MKFLLLSDLHLEFSKITYHPGEVPECDVVLLAGDIGPGGSGWQWADKTFSEKRNNLRQVLYIAGNHEYYVKKWSIESLNSKLLSKEHKNIQFLHNTVREFPEEKIVILGCTFWTDFGLNNNEPLDMLKAPEVMNDYTWIKYTDNRKLEAAHIKYENNESYKWLNNTIAHYKNLDWKVLVMTHHAPSQLSCSLDFRGNPNNVYYANKLDADYNFILPDVWVHGHMHNSVDHMLGDCRVLANPRGYARNGDTQNPEFNPYFTFDL